MEEGEAIARFREVVIDPLVRSGARKPHRFSVDQWSDEVDRMGGEFGSLSRVELAAAAKQLRTVVSKKKGRAFPLPLEIEEILRAASSSHIKETGGNSSLDDLAFKSVMRVWNDRRMIVPPKLIRLRRPVLFRLKNAAGAPSLREIADAGHEVPADVFNHDKGNM